MALTSPKMGLRIWNRLQDPFDHAQLADNFSKIDFHDHSPGRGTQIPSEGLADALITHAKLSAEVAATFTSWRNNRVGHGATIGASVAATNTTLTVGAVAGGMGPFYIDPADFAVAGRTTEFRVRGNVITNGTAPAANFTIGLYPITAWTGNAPSTLGAVLGAAVHNAPAANSRLTTAGAAFTPTAGWYLLGVAHNATTAAGSSTIVQGDLQMRFS